MKVVAAYKAYSVCSHISLTFYKLISCLKREYKF